MQTNFKDWAKSIIDKLSLKLRIITKLETKCERYDNAPNWRRILMGGVFYRAFLQVQLMSAMDAYIELDLIGRQECETLTPQENA
jgi:hypothetical protein